MSLNDGFEPKSRQREELERLMSEYEGPVIRTRQELETEYLTKLMKRDAAAWKRRAATNEQAAPEFDDATKRVAAKLKKVQHLRRAEAS